MSPQGHGYNRLCGYKHIDVDIRQAAVPHAWNIKLMSLNIFSFNPVAWCHVSVLHADVLPQKHTSTPVPLEVNGVSPHSWQPWLAQYIWGSGRSSTALPVVSLLSPLHPLNQYTTTVSLLTLWQDDNPVSTHPVPSRVLGIWFSVKFTSWFLSLKQAEDWKQKKDPRQRVQVKFLVSKFLQ